MSEETGTGETKCCGKCCKAIKVFLILLVVALVAIQLVPVNRANPAVSMSVDAPANVVAVLKKSCYDCHSNETVWPWYSKVAPVSWLVAHDVEEGREHVNFSEWDKYSDEKRHEIAEEACEETEEGKMPLRIYLIMHADAKLSEADLAALKEWGGE